jgi:RNA polymerase sigma factor (sigma-70 family)
MTASPTDLSGMFADLGTGDVDARNRLLTTVWDRLLRMASAALSRFPGAARGREAACVANELSLKLIRRLDAGGGQTTPEAFFGFAKRVLTNQLIEDFRTHRRRDRLLGPESTGERHLRRTAEDRCGDYDPAAQAVRNEVRERIEALPADERRVVELHVFENVRQSEIARLLGWPPKRVSRTWLAAVGRLAAAGIEP